MSGVDRGVDRSVLAGEYVLGTLPAEERARVAQEVGQDPLLRADVRAWEQALSPLLRRVAPVTPPAALWRRVERGLRAPGTALAPPREPMFSSAIWTGITAITFLLASALAMVVLLDQVPMAVPVATLAPAGGPEAAFVVEARKDGVIMVLPLHPEPVPAGHDLELWSVSDEDGAPRSLGLLPPSGLKLRSAKVAHGLGSILVTLEPKGGSPVGHPTGAVLYGGTVSMPD